VPNYGPGLIGIPCQRGGNDSDLLPSIIGMQKPSGTDFKKAVGLGPAAPLNEIGRAFLANPKYEWLFLTNDDNLCPPDVIPRLLYHDVDFVTGVYLSRIQPFEPVLFGEVKDHENLSTEMDLPEIKRSNRWYYRHLLKDGDRGMVPIVACGDGCLMIRRRVMEAIPQPWWEYGETMSDACDHDVVFSRKVREAGFGMWADLECRVGHITTMVVMPHRDEDGTWQTHLKQADRWIALSAASDSKAENR